MKRLAWADLRTVLDFLGDLYVARGLGGFAGHVVRTLPKVVTSERTSYNEINPRQRRNNLLSEPEIPSDVFVDFCRHMSEHPLITHFARAGDGRALKISDFLTREQFHRLALYNEGYRRVQVEYQIAFVLPALRPLVVGIALSRQRRDFDERDRGILNLLRPHVVQAYRNSEALTRLEREFTLVMQGEDSVGQGIVVLATDGHVNRRTSRATWWLAEYFGRAGVDRLPEPLWRWVRHEQRLLTGCDVPPPRRPLVIDKEGRRLEVRLLSQAHDSVLLLEERIEATPAMLVSLGLARREAQVLHWVAQGKTNPQIASILGTSPRTVGKHLERIYQKLGVETRTAAARHALDFLSLQQAQLNG